MKLPHILILAGILFGAPNLFAKFVPETNSLPRKVSNRPPAHWHTVKGVPGPNRPKIYFYNKLNPIWWFKNSDDLTPPDWYKPDDKHRNLKWSFRNPMHNFNFYVIGVADKKIT